MLSDGDTQTWVWWPQTAQGTLIEERDFRGLKMITDLFNEAIPTFCVLSVRFSAQVSSLGGGFKRGAKD